MTSHGNVNIRVFKYLIIVIIFSVFVNFPKLFEADFVTKESTVISGNITEVKTELSFGVSALRRDPLYIR